MRNRLWVFEKKPQTGGKINLTRSISSLGLDLLRRRGLEFSTEYPIPEATGHAKAILKVGKVVLKMVFLERLVVGGETIAKRSVLPSDQS